MKPFLDFRTFTKIYEAEEAPKEGIAAISPLMLSLYFQGYGELVSKLEGYKDVVKDLKDITNAEVDKKADIFNTLAKKLSGLIKDAEIKKEADGFIVPGIAALGEAYSSLIKTASDEDKKELQKAFNEGVLEFQNNLINAVKTVNESYFIEGDPILEKNTFKDERSGLIRDLSTIEADVNSLLENPPSDRIKKVMDMLSGDCKELKKELSDDKKWESMKRKERKARLEEIGQVLLKIKEKRSSSIVEEVVKSGIEKAVVAKIKDAESKIKEGATKMNDIAQKKIEAVKTEELNKEFSKDNLKLDDFKEIATGKKDVKNLQKKGPNLDKIKKLQEVMNQFLEKPIKADGLYGEGTEKAIAEVSKTLSLLDPSVKSDGKTMTPLLQAMLMKIDEKGGKDKIKSILDKAEKEAKSAEDAKKEEGSEKKEMDKGLLK
jgi:hypothetical protein